MVDSQLRVTLKNEIAAWMFALLTTFSKEEFIHVMRNIDHPKQEIFKKRFEKTQESYRQLCSLSTPRQTPFLGKPFIYGIKFLEGLMEESQAKRCNYIEYEVNNFHTKKKEVTDKIKSSKDFGSFANAVADSLTLFDKVESVTQSGDLIQKELSIFGQTLAANKELFDQLKDQQNERAKTTLALNKQREISQQAQQADHDINEVMKELEPQQHLQTSSDVEEEDDTLDIQAPLKYSKYSGNGHIKEAMTAKILETVEQKGLNGKPFVETKKRVQEALARSLRSTNIPCRK